MTNTLPQEANKAACPKVEEIDISHLLAETIRRSHYGESVSVLFSQIPYDTTQPYRHGFNSPTHSPPTSRSATPLLDQEKLNPALKLGDVKDYEPAAPSPLRNATDGPA